MLENKEMQIKALLLDNAQKMRLVFTHASSELGSRKMADRLIEWWKAGWNNGEVRAAMGASLTFVVAIGGYLLAQNVVESRKINKDYAEPYRSDFNILADKMGEDNMRCANCGNEKKSLLWDEGDTIYCSLCCHRTSKLTGEDDSVECPYCHRMRDRKAMYCRYCNDSSWQRSTAREYSEIDKILKNCGY